MSLKNYELSSNKEVYELVDFKYDKFKKTSTITILLNLPDMELRQLTTIDLPFTPTEPCLKYKMPPFTFRDEESVFMNEDTHERINLIGYNRCMPFKTRYAYQCEYDEWIYDANCTEYTGYIVWKAIKDYVLKREEEKKKVVNLVASILY